MTVPLAKDSRVGPLTMRELMYAPVGRLAGLPPIEPDVDPLRVPDAINESELMDVLIDVRREYAGLLLYAGGSLQLDVGNAFLLVARRLNTLTWSRPMGPAPGELGAHCVGGTAPMPVNGSRRFDLIGVMGGDIGLEAASMSFYALDMPGMDDPMPLYDDPDAARIEAGVVTFDKAATPIAASHWDASQRG